MASSVNSRRANSQSASKDFPYAGRSASAVLSVAAKAAGLSDGTSVSGGRNPSIPPTAVETTGRRACSASMSTSGRPSRRDAMTIKSAVRSSDWTSDRNPANVTRGDTPSWRDRASRAARSGPSPTISSRADGTSAHARSSTSNPLTGTRRPIAMTSGGWFSGSGSGGGPDSGTPFMTTSTGSPARALATVWLTAITRSNARRKEVRRFSPCTVVTRMKASNKRGTAIKVAALLPCA